MAVVRRKDGTITLKIFINQDVPPVKPEIDLIKEIDTVYGYGYKPPEFIYSKVPESFDSADSI